MNCATTNADTLKIGVTRIIQDTDNGGAQRPHPYNKEKKVGLTRFPSYQKE